MLLRNLPSFIIRGTFPKLTRPADEIKRRTREEGRAERGKEFRKDVTFGEHVTEVKMDISVQMKQTTIENNSEECDKHMRVYKMSLLFAGKFDR